MKIPVPPVLRGSSSGAALWIYVALYLIFLYLPICLIPLFSFNDSVQAAFPLKGVTLGWYRTLFQEEGIHSALWTSLEVGVFSAALATLCGVTVSYASVFMKSRFANLLSYVARLPILIPGVIIGIAMLIMANLVGIGPSVPAIIAGHTLVGLPATVMVMQGRFASFPRSIAEAAEDLGAREWTLVRRVLLPMAVPAVGSAFMLAFLTSFDEFIIAFFLSGPHPTLPVYIWGQLRFPRSLPIVMALGSLILAVSVVVSILSEALRRRGQAT
ncbi:spermidine/putrescine ABC transporter permease [Acetobacter estunensis NRIC 0472]|uniref:ABC transporter permease subunit n=1 Tax=Acetobacter estunensis TaxID=104097 RepID=A0A967B6S4_9PROT|nr:ABC transporter permease [Acetobacter estunensis]NHO54905.1 ABC transporter permease subunit [Acetobacter estunensis]GBQ23959.1 spermidine/putrescine ABC transporter permease [Acetobacter estunensis NRIC 0472]